MCTQHSWTDTENGGGGGTDDVFGNDLTQWPFVHHLSHVDMQHLLEIHSPSSVCRGQDSSVLLGKPIGMDVQVVKKSRVAWNSPKRTFCFQLRSFTVDVTHTVTMKYSIRG